MTRRPDRAGALFSCLGLACLTPAASMAQAVLPGTVSPGRVPEQMQPAPVPESHPPAASITLPETGVTPLSPAAAATPITVSGITVEGSTIYPPETFAAMAAPLLNHAITVGQLFDLAAAITAKYRGDGYILSRAVVPAQRIDNGIAHIQVAEGYIAKVAVDGSDNATLRAYADRIEASRPLRQSDLERYLLLANDLPGISVRAVVEPAQGVAAGAVLHLVAREKLLDGSLEFDNRGSSFSGPFEGSAGIAVNDLFGLSGRSSLRVGEAFPYRELRYAQFQQDQAIGNDGLVVTASVGFNRGQPGFTLAPLNPTSTGDNSSVRISYPILRARTQTWRVWATLASVNARTVLLGNPDAPPSAEDRIRALRIGTSYDFADAWNGSTVVQAEASQGLDFLGASPDNRPNPSRPFGDSAFRKITLDARRIQVLGFIAPGASLYLSAAGQTDIHSPLLAPEQFGVGGAQIGRGYDPSEITGDYGFAASMEPRYTMPLDAPYVGQSYVQPYAFYDFGATGYRQPTPATLNATLATAGFGARLGLGPQISGDLELARPLTRVAQEQRLVGSTDKPWLVYITLALTF